MQTVISKDGTPIAFPTASYRSLEGQTHDLAGSAGSGVGGVLQGWRRPMRNVLSNQQARANPLCVLLEGGENTWTRSDYSRLSRGLLCRP